MRIDDPINNLKLLQIDPNFRHYVVDKNNGSLTQVKGWNRFWRLLINIVTAGGPDRLVRQVYNESIALAVNSGLKPLTFWQFTSGNINSDLKGKTIEDFFRKKI